MNTTASWRNFEPMGWWLDLPIQPKQTRREQGMTKIYISSI
jgi:hypothetical protein